MTKRNVFSLAVNILGLYTFVMGFTQIPMIFAFTDIPQSMMDTSMSSMPIQMMLMTVLMILAGAALISLSDQISSYLITDDVLFALPDWASDRTAVIRVVLIAVGLVILAKSLPSVIFTSYAAVNSFLSSDVASEVGLMNRLNQTKAMSDILAVLLGAYLMFGGRSLLSILEAVPDNGK